VAGGGFTNYDLGGMQRSGRFAGQDVVDLMLQVKFLPQK
jgi:hypothetical protein